MPMTSAMFSMGKIIGPLVCEVEVKLAGMGMVFFVLLILTAALMFLSIGLNQHFKSIEIVAALEAKSPPVDQLKSEESNKDLLADQAQPLLSDPLPSKRSEEESN